MSLISIEISSWRDLNYNLPIQCAWKYKIYVNASAGQCSGRRLLHLHECKSGSVNDWVDWDEPPRRSFGFCFFSQSPHGGAIIKSCGVKMYGWPRNHRSCHCVKKQANHPLTMNQQFIHGTVWRHRCEDTLGEKKRGGRGSRIVKSNLELAHYYWINT